MKELKGFCKIKLVLGVKEMVVFEIVIEDLVFYGVNRVWEVELGIFKVFVGMNF